MVIATPPVFVSTIILAVYLPGVVATSFAFLANLAGLGHRLQAHQGPAATNAWHTAYLYARNDGKVKLWWDGSLLFDGVAPLVNPNNA